MSGMRPRGFARHSSARGLHSEQSSRYINTDHKRSQLQTNGPQAQIVAYNLSQNTRGKKKSRPKTAGRIKPYANQQQYSMQEQMMA
jgi:hypothetical protein